MQTREYSSIESLRAGVRFGRRPEGIAAALLPFASNGAIAVEAYQEQLRQQAAAGLASAVNMDTGYANLISDDERARILDLAVEALGPGSRFVAGAFVEGREGELVGLYRRQMDAIAERGGTPILFQTSRIHDCADSEIVDLYARICEGYPEVLGFELSPVFAPNGTIFSETVIEGLMGIPSLAGIKHSSLDRLRELRRLEIRDRVRPDFRIYTGNDLGIDMIEYGSDYLLGLAAFCPERFAERDRLWEAGDPAYFELSDALQHLGNLGFRSPVPAYKHSCAVFQHLLGRIPSDRTHPDCATRPAYERELMAECARRLGYEVA